MYDSYTTGVTLSAFLIGIALALAVFLIMRKFNCWYWKINERIRQNEEIIRLLKDIRDRHN